MPPHAADPAPVPVPAPALVPRRADARRNYERLLDVAGETFRAQGADAPLDEIARRAGVGKATMYRHFPTRRDLIIAVYADETAELNRKGRALLCEENVPGEALFGWFRHLVEHLAGKRDLALWAADEPDAHQSERFGHWHDSLRACAAALLDRAQRAGDARCDLRADDLMLLANGIALTGSDAERAARLIGLVRQGLEACPGSPDAGPDGVLDRAAGASGQVAPGA
ncbi:TetR/AcrR family transcriptional regulator [Streptomyces sp. NBC_00102]|uniref:TetR/AcrR family transcriptional regulator n=1 Tax=Streptomyces sp. NBC_00102 TaxID=2975652 RepID=UPI002256B2FA|nr:TetR/AcrR family transcriptional regulator [Streptomyces sp. NBC_00102]MCX5399863.1 TetR/AcrR family transcriptional regulator [Streptomyces sp. NBC_00102]